MTYTINTMPFTLYTGHYVLSLEDITFSVGETFKAVMINITNNEWTEPSRQLTLALSTANNRISPFKEATLTVLDDDSKSFIF